MSSFRDSLFYVIHEMIFWKQNCIISRICLGDSWNDSSNRAIKEIFEELGDLGEICWKAQFTNLVSSQIVVSFVLSFFIYIIVLEFPGQILIPSFLVYTYAIIFDPRALFKGAYTGVMWGPPVRSPEPMPWVCHQDAPEGGRGGGGYISSVGRIAPNLIGGCSKNESSFIWTYPAL